MARQMIPDIESELILHVQLGRKHFHAETPSRYPGHSTFGDAHWLLDARQIDEERQAHSKPDRMVSVNPNAGCRDVAHDPVADQHVTVAHPRVHQTELSGNPLGSPTILVRRFA